MTTGALVPSRWHRLIERILPWYDPESERRRDERTEDIRQRAISARINAENVRHSYREYANRLDRR